MELFKPIRLSWRISLLFQAALLFGTKVYLLHISHFRSLRWEVPLKSWLWLILQSLKINWLPKSQSVRFCWKTKIDRHSQKRWGRRGMWSRFFVLVRFNQDKLHSSSWIFTDRNLLSYGTVHKNNEPWQCYDILNCFMIANVSFFLFILCFSLHSFVLFIILLVLPDVIRHKIANGFIINIT